MDVHWKLFATLREIAGTGELSVEVPTDATVADAIDRLFEEYPRLEAHAREDGALAGHIRAIHEGTTVEDPETADQQLSHDDELALVPPLSGG